MNKIKVEINPQEVKKAIFGLPVKERIRFLEDLEERLLPYRFREIASILRSKAKKPVSLKKITKICKKVRKKLYEEETKGSN